MARDKVENTEKKWPFKSKKSKNKKNLSSTDSQVLLVLHS